MRVSVILGHPQKESFNHAIADTVVATLNENGYGVNFHDLYEEKFDPVLPSIEISKEAKTDSIIASWCYRFRK